MALPKVHRLKQRQEFSAVYQLGIKRTTLHLTLRALSPQGRIKQGRAKQDKAKQQIVPPIQADADVLLSQFNPDQPQPGQLKEPQPTQIGISVSQKVSKRAVVRNRIKRQIRSILHQFLPQLAPGWQIVIVVKPSAIQCDYEDFLRELEQLLMSAEVLDGH